MEEPNKNPEQDVAAVDFDIAAFLSSIFGTINANRSVIGPTPSDVVESPVNQNSTGRPAETAINTFFRLLGLPAVRNEEFLLTTESERLLDLAECNKRRNRALSQDRTLNYFSSVGTGAGLLDRISEINSRTNLLTQKVSVEDFNKIWREPIPIDEAVKDNPTRRTSLFPLLVDASVPVYPQSRRVAPLFHDGDYIALGGKNRLKRPFLQTVFYTRLKAYSGGIDAKLKESLKNNIENELGEQSDLIGEDEINGYNFIELKIIARLIQAIKSSVVKYTKTVSTLQTLKSEVDFTSAVVENPEERAGAASESLPREEGEDTPQLEQQIVNINTAVNRSELLLQALPTDQVNTSDRVRRLAELTPIGNISADVFVAQFTDLITYDLPKLKQKKAKLEGQRNKKVQKIEMGRRDMQYLTGEGVGLSIFDVISVLYGLFTVDINSLFGLLNGSAKERIAQDPFYAPSVTGTGTTETGINSPLNVVTNPEVRVEDALADLETQVKKAYSIATAFAEANSSKNQPDEQPVDNPQG